MNSLFRVRLAQVAGARIFAAGIVLRGPVIYFGLCLLLRVVLKRQAGKVSLSDLLVVTLVAGICRNPLVADAYSIPDGLGVVAVVLLSSFNRRLAQLSFAANPPAHSPTAGRADPRRPGHFMPNLRRELMTESQLHCQLRRKASPIRRTSPKLGLKAAVKSASSARQRRRWPNVSAS